MGIEIRVGISDYKVSQSPNRLLTLGLGSCVGVAIYDTETKKGGLSHIMLPDSTFFKREMKPEKFADLAIPMMVEEISGGSPSRNLVAKIAGNFLSSQIRSNVKIELGGLEQLSYDEFIRSIPKSTLMGLFRSKPLTGVQILEINPEFCNQAIALMCGGDEDTAVNLPMDKERFTDIELGILEEVVVTILKAFEAAWIELIEVETKLDTLETNPQLVQNISPNEPVVLISLMVEVLENSSFMNICIPYVSFENVIDKLSMRNWFDFEKDTVADTQEVLKDRIMASEVNLEVVLGKSIITVNDFLQLEAGDILQLDMKTTDPLKMYVEGKLHYFVKLGQINNRLAVQVLQYIEEDVEDE
ncbi:MAG: FliM/FliN family flagellar motor switch protein [Tissierellaceae bacterium]